MEIALGQRVPNNKWWLDHNTHIEKYDYKREPYTVYPDGKSFVEGLKEPEEDD
jgi:hypothetical protein